MQTTSKGLHKLLTSSYSRKSYFYFIYYIYFFLLYGATEDIDSKIMGYEKHFLICHTSFERYF